MEMLTACTATWGSGAAAGAAAAPSSTTGAGGGGGRTGTPGLTVVSDDAGRPASSAATVIGAEEAGLVRGGREDRREVVGLALQLRHVVGQGSQGVELTGHRQVAVLQGGALLAGLRQGSHLGAQDEHPAQGEQQEQPTGAQGERGRGGAQVHDVSSAGAVSAASAGSASGSAKRPLRSRGSRPMEPEKATILASSVVVVEMNGSTNSGLLASASTS